MPRDEWTIGELAADCGITVRALRHFEDKGLLGRVPRSGARQRRYGRAEVERIYQVLALRSLGLPLADVAVALATPPLLPRVLADHLGRIEAQRAELEALHDRLERLVDRPADQPISIEELITVIHQTAVSQEILHEYLDETDRARLADRAQRLGAGGARMVEVDYPRLYRAAQLQLRRGVAPDAPAMQRIAGDLEALAQRWTGPDAESSTKVQRLWAERSRDITGTDFSDLAAYVTAARAHFRARASAAEPPRPPGDHPSIDTR